MRARCDVLAPCALGGAISAEAVPKLRCEVVCGAANNQLADDGARRGLAERGDPVRAGLHRERGRVDQRLPRDHGLRRGACASTLARRIEETMARGARPRPSERGVTPLDAAARAGRRAPRRRRCQTERHGRRGLGRSRGQVPYAYAREAQKALEAARHAGEVPDLLLLLEHPPVYTKGRRTTADELPMGEDWYRMQGIDVTETDRGGRVTYHGPGQLVGYPIVVAEALRRRRPRVRATDGAGDDRGARRARRRGRLHRGPHRRLDRRPPAGDPEAFAPGIEPARRSARSACTSTAAITTHGFAINVNNDLQPFEWIVPCGIEACRMTSLTRELGAEQDLEAFATDRRDRFGEIYDRGRSRSPRRGWPSWSTASRRWSATSRQVR